MKFLPFTLFAMLAHTAAASGEFEWAGTFDMNDDTHTWSMQKVGGVYADPSMRMVLFAAETANLLAIEENEATAEDLIEGNCEKVDEGGTMSGITTAGVCYELHVDDSKATSLFTIDTAGLTGIAIFAQHIPLEFEKDQHYLFDSEGTDVEPVVQEGGGAHHHHGHGDEGGQKLGQSCACAALEYNFNIDCDAKTAMVESYDFMKSAGCAEDCSKDACQKAWLIVQAHHDYCNTDSIPPKIEDGFHDFDEKCKSCDISRIETPGAPDCPKATCNDSGNEAYSFLTENGCAQDCSSDECENNYSILRVVHDDCDHDVLSTAAEEGIHDFEDICTPKCNTPASKTDQLTCTSASPFFTTTVAAAGAIFGIAHFML